jgi:uncharacterized membrane protein YhaH (DUF805 family)
MIPTWIIALASFIAALLLVKEKRFIDIRFLAILFVMQFIVYLYFSLFDLPTETMKYAARLNNLSMSVAMIVVMLVLKVRNGR